MGDECGCLYGPFLKSLTSGGRRPKDLMARILCVDDESHAAKLKCIILETAGHQATPATTAKEAIALLEKSDYDVVVTDWRLGDATGRDIVVAARQLSDIPVVVISGYVNEAFQAPDPLADYYLEKPINPEELISLINDLVKSDQPSDL